MILAGLALALFASPCISAPIAYDHAGDPAYDDDWHSGVNGGYGFKPWVLTGGTFLISSSTQNNVPPTGPGGDIDSADAESWRVPSSGPVSRASRHGGLLR